MGGLTFQTLARPPLTRESVISELWFLLRRVPSGRATLLDMLVDGVLRVAFSHEAEPAPVLQLMKKYADTPMSFADACLVRMAELDDRASVFTLDSDFKIYRKHGTDPIPLITPP